MHGKEVAIITIKDGHARYTYVGSEIKVFAQSINCIIFNF